MTRDGFGGGFLFLCGGGGWFLGDDGGMEGVSLGGEGMDVRGCFGDRAGFRAGDLLDPLAGQEASDVHPM